MRMLIRLWTTDDDRRLLELRATGRSSRAIGMALRRSPKAVDTRLRILRKRDAGAARVEMDIAQ
jgi:DNA-binding CsgD family transcriptional regulator